MNWSSEQPDCVEKHGVCAQFIRCYDWSGRAYNSSGNCFRDQKKFETTNLKYRNAGCKAPKTYGHRKSAIRDFSSHQRVVSTGLFRLHEIVRNEET